MDQLSKMLDPTITGNSNKAVWEASQKARSEGKAQGLTGEALEKKVLVASVLAQNPDISVLIEGHTDNKGTYFNNMELSQNRTRSVLNFVLENTNYEPSEKSWIQLNLTANGLSYSKPIADNDTEQGQKKNRRVEFRIRTNAEKQIDEMLKVNLNE